MLDSVRMYRLCLAFLPFCTNPELEMPLLHETLYKTIHSRSYTYIIKNLYANPLDVFDTIIEDKKIEERSNSNRVI